MRRQGHPQGKEKEAENSFRFFFEKEEKLRSEKAVAKF